MIADADTPRPIRYRCEYIAAGPHALVGSTIFLTRLRRVVPGTADYTPGRLGSNSLRQIPSCASDSTRNPHLGKAIGGFLVRRS